MTRSLLMSALISLCCYNNLLADKDIAELGAEHFAKCSGLFAAAAVREERMGQTNKAYQFMRLSNGLEFLQLSLPRGSMAVIQSLGLMKNQNYSGKYF